MFKDILVAVTNDNNSEGAAEFALSAAKLFDSHVTTVACAYYPVVHTTTVMGALGVGYIDEEIAQNKKAAASAVERFQKAAGNQTESLVLEGFVAECSADMSKIARRFDLTIVSQVKDDMKQDMLIEALLFDSGRPLLIVPYIHKGGAKLDHVAVCWDGSRTAARALGDAMPLLYRAKKVSVLTVSNERPKSAEIPAADIAKHLARHGLAVELIPISVEGGDAAQILLSYAADRAINLFVMGGYGHSRLREFVLGGMTASMLESMTIPVFMSH